MDFGRNFYYIYGSPIRRINMTIPTFDKAINKGLPLGTAPSMKPMPNYGPQAQRMEVPRRVPAPADAIAPAPEAVQENEIPQTFYVSENPGNTPVCEALRASDKNVGGLAEPFNYENDLDEGGKRDLIKPLIDSLREKLAQETLSANDVSKCLNVSHTRITRNFPNGTKLSYILEHLPKPRSIDPDKLVGRLSESAKRELLAKLQQELG